MRSGWVRPEADVDRKALLRRHKVCGKGVLLVLGAPGAIDARLVPRETHQYRAWVREGLKRL